MNAPLVSVVIPTHNRPEPLRRALRSILAQTFRDYEVIVVDDGDAPRAKAVVDAFSDDRVRYVSHDFPNRGGSATRNTGIKNSRASLVAFLDDDDEWLPEKLERQMREFGGTPDDVGFCITGVITKSEKGESKNMPRIPGIADMSTLALTRFAGFMTSSLIVKKRVFDDCGYFDESLPSHQEIELMIRITGVYKGLAIMEALVVMDLFPHEHIGGSLKRRIAGREILLSKHLHLYKDLPAVLARHYFQMGLWSRDDRDKAKATTYFLRATKLSRSPRYALHLLRSFIPI